MLPELEGVKVFSKIDLKEGYLQIELEEESSMITTFQTPHHRGVGGTSGCHLELNQLQNISNTNLISALKAYLGCMQLLTMLSLPEEEKHKKKLLKVMT